VRQFHLKDSGNAAASLTNVPKVSVLQALNAPRSAHALAATERLSARAVGPVPE
jgi:hypothetical protein